MTKKGSEIVDKFANGLLLKSEDFMFPHSLRQIARVAGPPIVQAQSESFPLIFNHTNADPPVYTGESVDLSNEYNARQRGLFDHFV